MKVDDAANKMVSFISQTMWKTCFLLNVYIIQDFYLEYHLILNETTEIKC